MIRAIILFILLVSPIAGLASQETPEPVEGQAIPEQTSVSAGEQAENPQPQVWPRPFQPSEEVGADSEISFPTDI